MSTIDQFSDVVYRFHEEFNPTTFVETGTWHGLSTLWAAPLFSRVVTIDISAVHQSTARDRCRLLPHVEFIVGDSRVELPKVIATLTGPTMFWLDAHNENKLFDAGPNDCPLLEELAAIFKSPYKHVILVDDLHCLINGIAEFPHFVDVLELIKRAEVYECFTQGELLAIHPKPPTKGSKL